MSYGVDTWCAGSLVPGRLARGSQVVAQAIYRRLTTPRGMLRGGDDAGAYGIDLVGYVGSVGTAVALQALPSVVRGEILKDDRVADVTVTPTISPQPSGLVDILLVIDVVLAEDGEDFSLTLAVGDTSVTILGSP